MCFLSKGKNRIPEYIYKQFIEKKISDLYSYVNITSKFPSGKYNEYFVKKTITLKNWNVQNANMLLWYPNDDIR